MTLPKLNDLASQFLDFMRTIDSKFEKYDEECACDRHPLDSSHPFHSFISLRFRTLRFLMTFNPRVSKTNTNFIFSQSLGGYE